MRKAIDCFAIPFRDTSAEISFKKENLLKIYGNLYEGLTANTFNLGRSDSHLPKDAATQTCSENLETNWNCHAEKKMLEIETPNKLHAKTTLQMESAGHDQEIQLKVMCGSLDPVPINSSERIPHLSLKVSSPTSTFGFTRIN